MIIKVTKKHIKEGKCGSYRNCPIALALKSKGFTRVYVDGGDVRAHNSAGFIDANLPIRAMKFIVKFDSGRPVKPFSFRIQN